MIWCFKRFQNDRCSCSLDEVQIKPQRGVNERYFRIKKTNKILVLSVKHKRISRGRVVTEGQRGRAEEKRPILSLHSQTQLVLIHNLLGLLGLNVFCFAVLTEVLGCQRNPSLCCRWLYRGTFLWSILWCHCGRMTSTQAFSWRLFVDLRCPFIWKRCLCMLTL